jgi:hypothetical protein
MTEPITRPTSEHEAKARGSNDAWEGRDCRPPYLDPMPNAAYEWAYEQTRLQMR